MGIDRKQGGEDNKSVSLVQLFRESKMKRNTIPAKYRNYHRPWSESDIKTMRRLYPHTSGNQLARMLDRTPFGISGTANRLRLKKKHADEFRTNRPLELRRWSEKENRILKKLYPSHTAVEISELIDRTAGAIVAHANYMRLKKTRQWTQKEYAYLRRFHNKKPSAEVSRILGRTVETIRGKAKELGVARKAPRWPSRQEKLLIKYYPTMEAKKLAKRIGRTPRAINTKALELGIRRYPEDRRWTRQEDKTVRKYYRKMPYKELAIKLGCNYEDIRGRVVTLGLVGNSVWAKKDIEVLKKEFKNGAKVGEISKLVGKSIKTCYYKIKTLRLKRS